MDSKESMLEIQNLHVVYKTDLETVYAVNGLTFSLQKGQTLGLVGETGAGKTTLALTIMGLLPERTGKVTQGAVRFEGEDLIHFSQIFCENWQNPVKQRITPHFLTTSPSNYYEFTTKE